MSLSGPALKAVTGSHPAAHRLSSLAHSLAAASAGSFLLTTDFSQTQILSCLDCKRMAGLAGLIGRIAGLLYAGSSGCAASAA
jgi:hypothetical protein